LASMIIIANNQESKQLRFFSLISLFKIEFNIDYSVMGTCIYAQYYLG